jgi:hypothetical protein
MPKVRLEFLVLILPVVWAIKIMLLRVIKICLASVVAYKQCSDISPLLFKPKLSVWIIFLRSGSYFPPPQILFIIVYLLHVQRLRNCKKSLAQILYCWGKLVWNECLLFFFFFWKLYIPQNVAFHFLKDVYNNGM